MILLLRQRVVIEDRCAMVCTMNTFVMGPVDYGERALRSGFTSPVKIGFWFQPAERR